MQTLNIILTALVFTACHPKQKLSPEDLGPADRETFSAEYILTPAFKKKMLARSCPKVLFTPYFPGIQAFDKGESPFSDWGEDEDVGEIYVSAAKSSGKNWHILNYYNRSRGEFPANVKVTERESRSIYRYYQKSGQHVTVWGDEDEARMLSVRNNILSRESFLAMTWPADALDGSHFGGRVAARDKIELEDYVTHRGVDKTNRFMQEAVAAVFESMTCGGKVAWAHSGGGSVLGLTMRLIASQPDLVAKIHGKSFIVRGLESSWNERWTCLLERDLGPSFSSLNLITESKTWLQVIVPKIENTGMKALSTNSEDFSWFWFQPRTGEPHTRIGLAPFNNKDFDYPQKPARVLNCGEAY